MMYDEHQEQRRPPQPLTPDQINTYHRDGILVVHDLLSHSELLEARAGLANTLLKENGVDVCNLSTTGHNLINASSTNGAGGVLDIFYPDWKMKIATNERLFHMTCQLWKETYCYSGEKGSDGILNEDEANSYKWHPYGKFDYDRGYMVRETNDCPRKLLHASVVLRCTFSSPQKSRPLNASLLRFVPMLVH